MKRILLAPKQLMALQTLEVELVYYRLNGVGFENLRSALYAALNAIDETTTIQVNPVDRLTVGRV